MLCGPARWKLPIFSRRPVWKVVRIKQAVSEKSQPHNIHVCLATSEVQRYSPSKRDGGCRRKGAQRRGEGEEEEGREGKEDFFLVRTFWVPDQNDVVPYCENVG